MADRIVDPWVGAHYAKGARGSLKLLIVGDSHYEAAPRADLTASVILELAISKPIGFFEHLRTVALGEAAMCSPVEFWQKVAFCNLVQESMDSASAVPSLENFARGWRALRRTVAETDPHLIIFFTKRGWDANVLESEAIDLEGVGNNRRTESGVYGLNIYSRPGKHEIVATVANHPRHAMVWQGVWQTWTERAWKEAERIAW